MLLAGAGKVNRQVTSDSKLEEDKGLYNLRREMVDFPCDPEQDEA